MCYSPDSEPLAKLKTVIKVVVKGKQNVSSTRPVSRRK